MHRIRILGSTCHHTDEELLPRFRDSQEAQINQTEGTAAKFLRQVRLSLPFSATSRASTVKDPTDVMLLLQSPSFSLMLLLLTDFVVAEKKVSVIILTRP